MTTESGDTQYGKVRYYSETGKIKTKDTQGNAVAEMKGLSALSAAPGVFLIKPLSLVVINPFWAERDDAPDSFDYFPPSLLYAKAHRVYTGTAYNSVVEGGG